MNFNSLTSKDWLSRIKKVQEVVGLPEEGLPKDVSDEFFAQKDKMAKDKMAKDKESAEKRDKIAESLEKHIESKTEQSPTEE